VVPQRRLVKRRRGNRARPALGLRRHQRAKLEVLVPGDRALTMVVSKYRMVSRFTLPRSCTPEVCSSISCYAVARVSEFQSSILGNCLIVRSRSSGLKSRMNPHQVTQERMRHPYGVPSALSEFIVSAFRLSGRGVF
jgi:hypothetical protein